jgi:hypothetical protein
MADKSVLEVAKSQLIAYNKKDWPAVKESLAANIDYDEVGTQRDLRACQVIEVSGNKVQAIRHYFDMVSLLHQLGVM